MTVEPWNWTKADLDNLIGQAESRRLEFKQSRLLTESQPKKIIDELTTIVTAFANTEGGTIVIGMKERPDGKMRVADGLDDGVSLDAWWPERLQQTIEGNISPHLVGIRVTHIPVSPDSKNCAFVIHVPQGTTAFQASNMLYYGRSEFECKALPDQVIRLLMFRGKAPQAIVTTGDWHVELVPVSYSEVAITAQRYPEQVRQVLRLLQPDQSCIVRKYHFDLHVINTGEMNITEFKLQLQFRPAGYTWRDEEVWSVKDGWPTGTGGFHIGDSGAPSPPMKVNVYPEDAHRVQTLYAFGLADQDIGDVGAALHWTLYLPSTLPIRGQIDLAQAFADDQRNPKLANDPTG